MKLCEPVFVRMFTKHYGELSKTVELPEYLNCYQDIAMLVLNPDDLAEVAVHPDDLTCVAESVRRLAESNAFGKALFGPHCCALAVVDATEKIDIEVGRIHDAIRVDEPLIKDVEVLILILILIAILILIY